MRRNEHTAHVMQFFAYEHLPEHLQEVSKPFCELAEQLDDRLPSNPEKTVALRKLLESKDAAVRAVVAKPLTSPGLERLKEQETP
jgi:hypothetical protein